MNQSFYVGDAVARLRLDPSFRPCDAEDGDEIFANGIFKFNITRLLAHIEASHSFPIERIDERRCAWPLRTGGGHGARLGE